MRQDGANVRVQMCRHGAQDEAKVGQDEANMNITANAKKMSCRPGESAISGQRRGPKSRQAKMGVPSNQDKRM